MSLPAVNTPPLPRSRARRFSASRSAVVEASISASYIAPVMAFFFCGRAKAADRTAPSRATSMSLSCHVSALRQDRFVRFERRGARGDRRARGRARRPPVFRRRSGRGRPGRARSRRRLPPAFRRRGRPWRGTRRRASARTGEDIASRRRAPSSGSPASQSSISARRLLERVRRLGEPRGGRAEACAAFAPRPLAICADQAISLRTVSPSANGSLRCTRSIA